jgi:hypothetical protein
VNPTEDEATKRGHDLAYRLIAARSQGGTLYQGEAVAVVNEAIRNPQVLAGLLDELASAAWAVMEVLLEEMDFDSDADFTAGIRAIERAIGELRRRNPG